MRPSFRPSRDCSDTSITENGGGSRDDFRFMAVEHDDVARPKLMREHGIASGTAAHRLALSWVQREVRTCLWRDGARESIS